jgi:heme A synthase
MRQTYRVVASLIALGVLVQAAAVAFGWFQVIRDVDSGEVFTKDSDFNLGQVVHLVNGLYLMPVLGLILLGVSFAAAKTVPQARKWAGIVLGLIVLQVCLAIFAFMFTAALGALHGINALVLLGCAGRASMLARAAAPATADGRVDGIPAPRTESTSSTGADLPA